MPIFDGRSSMTGLSTDWGDGSLRPTLLIARTRAWIEVPYGRRKGSWMSESMEMVHWRELGWDWLGMHMLGAYHLPEWPAISTW